MAERSISTRTVSITQAQPLTSKGATRARVLTETQGSAAEFNFCPPHFPPPLIIEPDEDTSSWRY